MARFGLLDLDEQLDDFVAAWPSAKADGKGRAFVAGPDAPRLELPFVLPPPAPGQGLLSYRAGLQLASGRRAVVLLQAGAMAVGYWDGDTLLAHKAEKRYVVRGNGKAQPLHLRSKGKSRYGSRLRLQNWKRLLATVQERLRDWWREFGQPEQVFLAMGDRTAVALVAAKPGLPFALSDPGVRRLPVHVHVPDHEELLAVDRWLCSGRLVRPSPPQ
jgi:hypothetical protein